MKLFVTVIGTALGQGVMGPNFGPVNNWWPWIFGGQGLWTSNQPTDPCNNNNQIWGAWGSWGQCDSTGSRWREAPCLVKESCPSLCQYDLLEKTSCETRPPLPAIYGPWSEYSTCNPRSNKCNRVRQCIRGPCTEPLLEEKVCTMPPEPTLLHCCGVETNRCNEQSVPDVCDPASPLYRQYFFQSEKTRSLCAFNTLCIKRPEIFKVKRVSSFSGELPFLCGLTTIHQYQRCLSDQISTSCSGLNGQIVEQCWTKWKIDDYNNGNILTPSG
jgi:hypothetical protein